MKQSKKNRKSYNPNVGFIGNSEVKVSNYLFSRKRLRTAYKHAKPIADRLMNVEVSGHYTESRKLTKFLKNRDLTFSKKTPSGDYKTFVVPCTTTVVPLQKSIFNEVEVAAQGLIISLRKVIQDIYSAKSIKDAKFVKSLPKEVRDIFITAIETSPNYFPQFHHKNMGDYPFFDNVGLDLVLVEDYMSQSKDFPALIAKKNTEDLPGLPFRILELNAGSPSGASNNMNVLEGIYDQAPDILENLGKMMPNDHFKILGETYKSLGEYWTDRKDGVQILLPPGGGNGAAPEIHQLAAYSGLIYTDADQLYQDQEGYIRLRTVSKENPIVNAVYSRINADSALFDIKKGLVMRDPDTGKDLYMTDDLIKDAEGEGKLMLDEKGNPVPLDSSYAIPGLINAVLNKKIYMGGLNRILDNKIILATLTHYAPKFFKKDIEAAGVPTGGKTIMPPQTLPPTMKSVEIIESNPDEWVVKAPELAGGQGVYILKTLPKNEKEAVLAMIRKNPQDFAYQQLVKIARIPVAVQRKEEGYKFANLAADIRTWVFFGAGEGVLPRMSHNALVRYAPCEKGKMSSIVNTSAGGGYAPFVIIDDTNDKDAVSAKELCEPKKTIPLQTDMPVFVAAQLVQVSRMLKDANRILSAEQVFAFELLELAKEMKNQLKEILSFLHPRSIESIYKVIEMLETRVGKTESKEHNLFINENQLKLVSILADFDGNPEMKLVREILDNMRVLNTDRINLTYCAEDKALDLVLLDDLISVSETTNDSDFGVAVIKVSRVVKRSIGRDLPNVLLGELTKKTIRGHFDKFCEIASNRLNSSPKMAEFSSLLNMDADVTSLSFETLYLGKRDIDKEIKVASQKEMRTGTTLIQSDYIDAELKAARREWKQIQAIANTLSPEKKDAFIAVKRTAHFGKFPRLARYQNLINSKNASKEELIDLLDIAPYAKFNIENFAKEQGLPIEDIFTDKLKPNRISVLSTKQLQKLNLTNREHAGECFAKKKKANGLYSNSNIYVWLRAELDPFTLIYTAGHELIHYQQIKHSMEAEKRALKDGGISIAKFLNYYGNFLGSNSRTVDKLDVSMEMDRTPLYGYAERVEKTADKPVLKELDQSIRNGDQAWDENLQKYGSLFGYMMESTTGIRVKAMQEVLPALENAKNILFAKDLGLEINYCEVQATMPAANQNQVEYYRDEITEAAKSANPEWEALRLIASHQYHGVNFFRADKDDNNLRLVPNLGSISVGSSYNQTQQ